MAAGFGASTVRTVLGVGKESTRGTAVSATTTIILSTLSLKETSGWDEGVDLWAGVSGHATDRTEVARDVGGALGGLLQYSALGLVWEGVFGTVSDGGGGGPTYTHTFTMSRQAALPTYTLREGARDFSADDHVRVYAGCIFNEVTWEWSRARGLATWSAQVLGMALDSDADGTPGSPTIGDRVVAHQLTTLSWNSVSYAGKAETCRIKVNNGMARQEALGSLTAVGFLPNARRQVELTLTMMLTTDEIATLRTAQRAGTTSDLSLVFTGPSSQTLTWTMTDAQIADLSDPANSYGKRAVTVLLRSRDDGTNAGLTLVSVNGTSLYSG